LTCTADFSIQLDDRLWGEINDTDFSTRLSEHDYNNFMYFIDYNSIMIVGL
jgi:hypothetical protein